jgi:hypothetical protein
LRFLFAFRVRPRRSDPSTPGEDLPDEEEMGGSLFLSLNLGRELVFLSTEIKSSLTRSGKSREDRSEEASWEDTEEECPWENSS